MKTKLFAAAVAMLLLIALLSFSLPALAQTPPASVTVLSTSNLRVGPGTTFDRVGGAQAGQTLTIVGCNDACDWYELDTGQWIAAFLVEPSLALAATSAAIALPTATPLSAVLPAAPSAGATANGRANLRGGPGTDFPILGSAADGQGLEIVGRNESGDWYQLASGAWIAAFLVDDAPAVSIVGSASVAAPTPVPTVAPAIEIPSPTPAAANPTSVPVEENPAPVVIPTAAPRTGEIGGACDPNYTGACIPIVGYDLNCPDVGARDFQSIGNDRHRFDRDNDGIACESD